MVEGSFYKPGEILHKLSSSCVINGLLMAKHVHISFLMALLSLKVTVVPVKPQQLADCVTM